MRRFRYKVFTDNILKKFAGSRATPDAIAKFHWPGDQSTLLGTTLGYPFDITNARDAAKLLAAFLLKLPIPGQGAASLRITFVGHSMGCRLILEALGRMTSANAPGVEVVGLMAAASPVDLVKRMARLFKTGNPPRRMLKFFSERDTVLQFGFPPGQLAAFLGGIEVANYDEAVGRHGNPDEFGSKLQTNNEHRDYWWDTGIVAIVVKNIDATTPAPIPAAEKPKRPLLPAAAIAGREMLTRTLPS